MGRTALYREYAPFRPPRAELHLDVDVLAIAMPDGWTRRHPLDGCAATTSDGFVAARGQRRFVRMLVIDQAAPSFGDLTYVIPPPEHRAVPPNVLPLPQPPPPPPTLH